MYERLLASPTCIRRPRSRSITRLVCGLDRNYSSTVCVWALLTHRSSAREAWVDLYRHRTQPGVNSTLLNLDLKRLESNQSRSFGYLAFPSLVIQTIHFRQWKRQGHQIMYITQQLLNGSVGDLRSFSGTSFHCLVICCNPLWWDYSQSVCDCEPRLHQDSGKAFIRKVSDEGLKGLRDEVVIVFSWLKSGWTHQKLPRVWRCCGWVVGACTARAHWAPGRRLYCTASVRPQLDASATASQSSSLSQFSLSLDTAPVNENIEWFSVWSQLSQLKTECMTRLSHFHNSSSYHWESRPSPGWSWWALGPSNCTSKGLKVSSFCRKKCTVHCSVLV